MVAIRDLPVPPGPDRPTTLETDTLAFLLALKDAFVPDANALAAYLAQSASPAMSIGGLFDALSISDSNPGAGNWRLNNATQNAATFAYASTTDALGGVVTAILDALDDSTSATKGYIRFTSIGDGSKWLLFKVNGAVQAATGYRKVPLLLVASSAASPFADDEQFRISFTPNGDKGDAGVNLPWQSGGLSAVTITGSPTTVTFGPLPNNFANVLFDLNGITISSASQIYYAISTDGGASFGTPVAITGGGGVTGSSGLIEIIDYLFASGWVRTHTTSLTGAAQRRSGGAVTHVRLSAGGVAFTGGVITPRFI